MNTRLFDMQAVDSQVAFALIPDAPETVREPGGLWRLADLLPSSERAEEQRILGILDSVQAAARGMGSK